MVHSKHDFSMTGPCAAILVKESLKEVLATDHEQQWCQGRDLGRIEEGGDCHS